jgi:hypothetical protein
MSISLGVNQVEGGREFTGCDRCASHANALCGLDQVRRHEQARAHSGDAQRALDHGARGALAVGAGHVHETARRLRIAQRRQQRPDPLQAELDGLEFVAQSVEELDRIGIRDAQKRLLTRPAPPPAGEAQTPAQREASMGVNRYRIGLSAGAVGADRSTGNRPGASFHGRLNNSEAGGAMWPHGLGPRECYQIFRRVRLSFRDGRP